MKEARYAHLLSGDVELPETTEANAATAANAAPLTGGPSNSERITALEDEVSVLKKEVGDLKSQLASFRKQFE